MLAVFVAVWSRHLRVEKENGGVDLQASSELLALTAHCSATARLRLQAIGQHFKSKRLAECIRLLARDIRRRSYEGSRL